MLSAVSGEILSSVNSDDLTIDDLKIGRGNFFIIFDALSNAAYRVSYMVRDSGAELEGGGVNYPPAWCGNPGPPTGRGLRSYKLYPHVDAKKNCEHILSGIG